MKLKKILIIILATPFVLIISIICIMLLTSVIQENLAKYNSFKLKLSDSYSCEIGSIKTYSYFSYIANSSYYSIYVYENNNKKIFLGGSARGEAKEYRLFGGKNINQKDIANSQIASFPLLNCLQKDLQFEIIDTKTFNEIKRSAKEKMEKLNSPDVQYEKEKRLSSFYYQLPQTDATYINPESVTKEEFKQIVNCARNNHKSLFRISNIFVYKKYNPKFITINCLDPKGEITIEANSTTKFKIGGAPVYLENVYLGYYDEKANFIREKSIDEYFEYDIKGHFDKFLKDVGFPKAYKESQTLKLLFNDKGKPINDYLKTCKNSEGKTIFNIFRPKTK